MKDLKGVRLLVFRKKSSLPNKFSRNVKNLGSHRVLKFWQKYVRRELGVGGGGFSTPPPSLKD